jgi:hypothetical protein
MEENLSIHLIIDILNDKTIGAIDDSIGTQISSELLKASKSLGDIHACFTDNLLVFIDRIPNKLNLF